ncbi:pitrilysin family protein [Massilia sp. Root335]|uniref:M16 family metallopeptidase n=1 Tax=Massilia sp. Root335 TaxID=1736517 RepID=UPI0007006F94|nr:M16 family metallopeptidase [Massilia sp. Root335]KQV40234.1 peptidase M16 [Massilia sp. Root335]
MPSLFRATVLAAALAAALPATAAVDLGAQIPVGPQVKVGKLANGLTWYVQRNGKPEHRVELRLVVKAGSVLEDDDQQGLAHMVEHLAFNGSTHFKKQELISYLQSIGVKFGADVNAYTGLDETVYMLPVPTDRKDNVETAFTVLEDWAHGLTLNADDIDKERAIVLEEARLRKGAAERMQKALAPKLFNGSRYALREPIGKEDVIRNAKPDALRRFYHDWYRPDLMAVIVVGDIDPADAERLVKAHFGGLANPPHERVRAYPDIAARATTEAFVFADDEIPGNAVTIHYPVRFEPITGTYGDYRNKVVNGLATLLLNLRLRELTQQANPPFLGAGANTVPLTAQHKAFMASASLGAGGAAPAIAALEQEQQRVRQFGFTEAELERARKMALSGMERGLKERDTTDSSSYVAEYQRNFLAGESLPGIDAEFRLVQELLPTITVADLNAAARKAFPADAARLIVYAGNTKTGPAPTTAQLLADDAAASHAQVTDHAEKKVAQHLMARPAAPGRIVAETRDETLGLTRLTLSNGVQVILKPTAFRKDQVLLGAKRFGGQTLFDEQDIPNARAASGLAAMMGLKDYAPADLQKMLAGRDAAVTAGLGDYTDEISGHSGSGAEDMETMFQLLWLRFDGVRRDEALYKAYMGSLNEMVRNRAAAPEQRFGEAVADTLYQGHPYELRMPRQEDVDKIDLDRSLALYRRRFASARGMTFIVVGDFDMAAMKPLVAAYLGTLPTPDLPLAYRDVGLRIAKGVVKKEVQAGTEPKSIVSLTFSGPAAWSPAETLRMGALIEVMNLRVNAVLREKLGLIYAGQMGGALLRIPYEHYEISAQLPTGPDKVDPLVAALFAEIDSVKANGPTQAELDKVKANWRQNFMHWQHENNYWVSNLEASLLENTPPSRLLTITDEVEKLTAADVQAAARRYFDKDNYVQVVLQPEAKLKTASIAK